MAFRAASGAEHRVGRPFFAGVISAIWPSELGAIVSHPREASASSMALRCRRRARRSVARALRDPGSPTYRRAIETSFSVASDAVGKLQEISTRARPNLLGFSAFDAGRQKHRGGAKPEARADDFTSAGPAGGMGTAHCTATRLAFGKVLLAGGEGPQGGSRRIWTEYTDPLGPMLASAQADISSVSAIPQNVRAIAPWLSTQSSSARPA